MNGSTKMCKIRFPFIKKYNYEINILLCYEKNHRNSVSYCNGVNVISLYKHFLTLKPFQFHIVIPFENHNDHTDLKWLPFLITKVAMKKLFGPFHGTSEHASNGKTIWNLLLNLA